MKKFTIMLLMFCLLGVTTVMAQGRTLGGKVIDSVTKQPIAGATVTVMGTSNGAYSLEGGEFVIPNVQGAVKLEVTFFGYTEAIIEVAASATNVEIMLTPSAMQMDEVVVLAYGKADKRSLTGAVAVISSDKIEDRPVTNVTSAIAGSTPGIQTTVASGAPGSTPSIRIRGIGSITSSNDPLYVVDGIPFTGSISDLSSDDVASMTILKDAASTALYGSRASNGVILIQTKTGRKERVTFNVKISQGFQYKSMPEYDMLSVSDYYEYGWEASRSALQAAGETLEYATAKASRDAFGVHGWYNLMKDRKTGLQMKDEDVLLIENWGGDSGWSRGVINPDAVMFDQYDDLNWLEQLSGISYRQNYSVSASGGSDKASYYNSVSYTDEDGFLDYTNFKRLTALSKVDISPTKWLKFGTNIRVSYTEEYNPWNTSDAYASNPWFIGRWLPSMYPVYAHYDSGPNAGDFILDNADNKMYDRGVAMYDAEGNMIKSKRGVIGDDPINSIESASLDRFVTTNTAINGTAYAAITFLKDFKATIDLSIGQNFSDEKQVMNSVVGDQASNGGLISQRIDRLSDYTFRQLLEWSRTFDKHSVGALVGHENMNIDMNVTTIARTGNAVDGMDHIGGYVNPFGSPNGLANSYRSESYFGKINYGYDDKYFLDASFRRDGSSKFSEESRWGNFWSAGASWIISAENFMANAMWVDFLKLRASYGTTGNDGGFGGNYISQYVGRSLFANSFYSGMPTYSVSVIGAPELKWETGVSFDIGVDFRLWNRLNGSIGYYERRTNDLILKVPQPQSSGVSTLIQNIGSILNRGVEISLDVDAIRTRDWHWNIGLNFTWGQNIVTSIPEANREDGISMGSGQRIFEGGSIYEFWLPQLGGVDAQTGAYYFELDTEKKEYDGANKEHSTRDGKQYTTSRSDALFATSGDGLPPVQGSITSSLTWKNLTLDLLFTYRLGGVATDNTYQNLMSATNNKQMHENIKDSWRKPGDKASLPRIDPKNVNSSFLSNNSLIDNSFFALQNVTLSYKFPKKIANKLTLKGLSIYASGENLFQISSLKGYDAQSSFNGYVGFVGDYYGAVATVSFGVNVSF